jgi:hypothetical protein
MGETTQIIQRRIRHWKTTIAGISLILAPVAGALWPEYAAKITQAALLLAGGGFIAAADAQRPPTPPAP